MTITGKKRKKVIAVFFLALLVVQDFYPAAAYALTSGPSQPEMQKFSPAGAGDMVDLFTGDFKYDIPLMDVGGYPINLSYHSGAGIEDEASWVGVGWTLNPGAVNRNMRGIPDDFTGDDALKDPADVIQTTQHRKDHIKIGGNLVIKGAVVGFTIGNPKLKVGVYNDSYYGIGADLGASLDFSIASNSTTSLTAGLQLTTDSKDGVTVDPSLSLCQLYDEDKENNNTALTGSFAYNTRSGLESQSLGQTFNFGSSFFDEGSTPAGGAQAKFDAGSWTKYYTHTYTPTFGTNISVTNSTFSFDLGPELSVAYAGLGGEGYWSKESMTEMSSTIPAYGYMHYTSGTKNPAAMLDFNREKDGTFITNAPAIPIPVSTEDYFDATSQSSSEQFRPVYNGNYITYDRPFTKTTSTVAGGVTIGGGDLVIAGAQLQLTNGNAITHQWSRGTYISTVTPKPGSDPVYEGVYFKKVGEQTKLDPQYFGQIWGFNTQKILVSNNSVGGATASPAFLSPSFPNSANGFSVPITRQNRDIRSTGFSYLTAAQASQYGLDRTIEGQPRVDPPAANRPSTVHKPHHISEITVTEKDGKRRVYGLPVYNFDREEVSMSVNGPIPATNNSVWLTDRRTGLIGYTPGSDNTVNNGQGRENIYSRKVIPPYATSYLLTGILSPDYVDLTGDGISDDDLGTAVKFHYKQGSNHYHWRAPYDANMANYAEGFLSDKTDDKGNYVFGTKELWYLDMVTSKTMVAEFFTSNRQDGLGVLGENGGRNTGDMVQELDSIRLFSYADLVKNTTNAVPIKVAHFQYDYSLVPGVPNNTTAGQGKLTLRKLWFTFGNSSRGVTNPYQFAYDMRPISGPNPTIPALTPSPNPGESQDMYAQRQTDRWGTYRQSYFTTPSHSFNNSEFPYSIQPSQLDTYDQRVLADRFASKWQLNSITTPMGGIISVNYESDDYSYVQDQKAMIMCQVSGVGTGTGNSGLIKTNLLYVKLPVQPASGTDFIQKYLTGADGERLDNVFYKMSVDLNGFGNYEYVYGYAQVDYGNALNFKQATDASNNPIPNTWSVPVKLINENGNNYNPVAVQAWQLVQTDLPQYAYPGYDNSQVTGLAGNVAAAVRSIVQAFGNLRELTTAFSTIASNSGYANKVDLSHSLVRLNFPVGSSVGIGQTPSHLTYGKLGGGSRVQSIELNDNWGTMVAGSKNVAYGIQYAYTIKDDNSNTISSGVASYEPEIGNEENPFHQPLDYTENVQWGQDRYHYLEKPFGESYFPAPAVGYSQVTATPYGVEVDNNNQHVGSPQMNTGYTLNQFYTSKDFPTQVDYIPLEQDNYEYDLTLLLFAARYTNRVTTDQGFKITLNDMHGKQKAVKTYDNSGSLISSMQYSYSVSDPNAQQKTLNNQVLAMDADGTIPSSGMLIGTDAELITDLRESNSTTSGTSIGAYPGGFLAFLPIPFFGFNYSSSSSLRTYNSASTIKVIHQYGLLQEVQTTKDGSTLAADNLLWDAQTGDVLLTRNQNEFNDYSYTLNYPAFHAYDGMSGAYKNMGMVFNGFQSDVNGIVTAGNADANGNSGVYNQYLSPGDELVNITSNVYQHGWLVQPGDGTMRFIDASGNFISASGTFMVVRPGRRNVLDASAGTVVTMVNPLIQGGSGYILEANVDQKVLDAKAVTYKDEWGLPVPNFLSQPTTTTAQEQLFAEDPGNYELTYLFASQNCLNQEFYAYVIVSSGSGGSLAIPTRAFGNFGEASQTDLGIPANATLTNATLNLTAYTGVTTSTSGANAAYIRRVTQPNVNCGVLWDNQAATTTVDQAPLAQSTVNDQNYQVDVTAMYKDWVNMSPRDNFDFSVALIMADETSTGANRFMDFYGANSNNIPTLVLTYSVPGTCTDPLNNVFNPYYNGVKGNWRPYYNYAYQVNRVQTPANNSQSGGTDIRHSGHYSSYTPFWLYNNPQLIPIASVPGAPGSVADPRWVWSSQSIYYDQKGNEIEDVDALNRYGSVLFGYQQSLATAVAKNARHNEIAYDGFEDYYFSLPTNGVPCPLGRQLNLGLTLQGGSYTNGGATIVSYPSPTHTGNYSLRLGGTLTITAPAGSATPPSQWVGYDANGHAILLANEQAAGFAPIPGQPYLLSFWVYDGDLTHNVVNGLTVAVNNSNVDLTKAVPLVEGWKQVNYQFTAGSSFSMQLQGGGSIYIDDLRLLPFKSEMKTFVYDDQSLRLMGQLDENNFGILYEYDEEGTPIRFKKETERGVMTIKESRQSLKAQ